MSAVPIPRFQFCYSYVPQLSCVTGSVTFGAATAITSFVGTGISSVTKLAVGLVQVQLVQPYPAYLSSDFSIDAPTTGANVNDGSFVVGTLYQITAVGTTNWYAVGLNAGLTPKIGQLFVATAVGGAGTGTAKVITQSNVAGVQVAENNGTMLSVSTANQGSIFILQTVDFAGALVSPTTGTIMDMKIWMKGSSAYGV